MSRTFRIGWRGLFALGVVLQLLLAGAPAAAQTTGGHQSRVAAAAVAATTIPAPPPPPKAWILVDSDTAKVIDSGNDRTPLPPASLTKVITALAVGPLPPDTPVPVSAIAAAQPADKLFMKAGSVWTADQMLHSLLLSSANDAAVALAEKVGGGTVAGFQPIFARTALGLGMADHPVLKDPAGLDGPDGVDGGNLVSARDLAIGARALLGVPSLAEIVGTPVYYFDGPDNVHHRLTNHNKLFLTTFAGGAGVKTGYTKRAGACLIAAARRDGRTMVAVILNGSNPTQTAKDLLERGFATPAGAESAADQLPPVLTGAAGGAITDTPIPSVAPPPPVEVTAPAAKGAGAGGGSSWAVVAAVAVGGGALMGLVLGGRRRRRRRRIFTPAHQARPGRAGRDRWAA